MSASGGPRRRRPSAGREIDAPCCGVAPTGDWLTQCGGVASADLDFDALAEASELGLNTGIRGSLLSDLRARPPPSFVEAQGAAAAVLAGRPAQNTPVARRVRSSPGPSHQNPLQVAASLALPRSRSPSHGREPVGVAVSTRPPRAPLLSGDGVAAPRPSNAGPGSPASEESLTGVMAARLRKAEQLTEQLTEQLAEQTRENVALRKENEVLRRHSQVESSDGVMGAALRNERDDLQRRLVEMEQLLHSYGLRPAGSVSAPSANRDCAKEQGSGGDADKGGMEVNINVLQERVEGINDLLVQETNVASGMGRRVPGHIASFVRGDICVPITFFSDGVKVADHAFLNYSLRPAQDVIKDILDGSFPRTLQAEYPDGVELRVVDRTGFRFVAWLRERACDDKDLAEGGDCLRPSIGCAAQKDSRSAADRLLAKLPERVIKDGQVCDIRGAIAKKVGATPAAVAASSGACNGGAPAGRWQSNEVSMLNANRLPTAPFAKLQVKLEGGQRVQLIMEPCDTIGSLWEALARWRAENGIPRMCAKGRSYSLRTAFPPQAYTDNAMTLEAAGLTPTATLFVSSEAGSDEK